MIETDQLLLTFDENLNIVSYQLPDSISKLVRTNSISIDTFQSFTDSFDYYYCHSHSGKCFNSNSPTSICLEKYFRDYTISITGNFVRKASSKTEINAKISLISNSVLQLNQLIEIIINEIRNPIAGLIATSNLYLDYGTEFKLDKDEYFTLSKSYALKMSKFIDQVLCLLRIDAKEVLKTDSIVHINSIVNECIVESSKDLESAEISIESDIDPDFFINGNEELIRAAFLNIFQNTIQFSGIKRDVKIESVKVGDLVGIKFIDKGLGIPPEFAMKIFDSFYRIRDTSIQNQPLGLGLGLSLVKSIVNHQKGKLNLCSHSTNGTTFTILFPELQLQLK